MPDEGASLSLILRDREIWSLYDSVCLEHMVGKPWEKKGRLESEGSREVPEDF